MNNARAIAAELDAMSARLQALKDELLSDEPPASPWCTVAEYADHARVHPETVRIWIRDGMPALDVKKDREGRAIGTKRTTRIDRQVADAWRAAR